MAIINKETIISAFDDKMTLLQFLKNIEKALVEGILKNVKVVRVDSGHVKIVFTFEDGTTQETNSIVLGEADLFTLATLIEGSESVVVDINENNTALEVHIDADVMRKINNALQLPVARPNEQKVVGVDTTNAQNLLGLGEGLQIENEKIKVGGTITDAEVIEDMSDYSFREDNPTLFNLDFAGVSKNGNKLTFAIAGATTLTEEAINSGSIYICAFNMPYNVSSKLYPSIIAGLNNVLSFGQLPLLQNFTTYKTAHYRVLKSGANQFILALLTSGAGLVANTPYYFRFEETFLLSNNLVVGEL